MDGDAARDAEAAHSAHLRFLSRSPGSAGNGASTARRSGRREPGSIGEHPQRGLRAGRLARLAHRLADASPAVFRGASLVDEPRLLACRRTERLHLHPERLGGRRELAQLGHEHELEAARVGARLAQRDSGAPGAALHEARRQRQRAQRAPAPLGPRQEARDQQLERVLELRAGRGLGQRQPLHDRLGGPARLERRCRARARGRGRAGRGGRSARTSRGRAARPARRACGCRAARASRAGRRAPPASAAAGPAAARGTPSPPRRRRPRPTAAGARAGPPRRSRSGWARRRSGRRGRRRRRHVSRASRLAAVSTPSRWPPWMPHSPPASKKA